MFQQEISEFLLLLEERGATPFIVGGAVRDCLLGRDPKDLDIEVYGVNIEKLMNISSSIGKTSLVGASFGVIKLQHPELGELDLTLPRRDNKAGRGHTGFTIEVDPNMTTLEGSSRRDFTFNAMMWSPSLGILDHFDGQQDLEGKVLRHVGPAFSEDPLRVLRGMQFCGRMGLTVAPETAELCRSLKGEYSSLPLERVWMEWEKWATKSMVPSKGIQFLKDTGWISLYPHLENLDGVPQNPKWHPEGDVLTHTMMVCDEAANISRRESLSHEDRLVLMFSALCHDLAKATHTVQVDGVWRSNGHEKAGGPLTEEFLRSIGAPNWLIKKVCCLVVNHLAHANEVTPRMVRRLSNRLSGGETTIQQLGWLVEADASGREPLPKGMPKKMKEILEVSKSLGVSERAPKRVLTGKDLIAFGLKPGKSFGVILEGAFEAQLDGLFSSKEEALEWLKNHLRV